jgi:hypothetical protein
MTTKEKNAALAALELLQDRYKNHYIYEIRTNNNRKKNKHEWSIRVRERDTKGERMHNEIFHTAAKVYMMAEGLELNSYAGVEWERIAGDDTPFKQVEIVLL